MEHIHNLELILLGAMVLLYAMPLCIGIYMLYQFKFKA